MNNYQTSPFDSKHAENYHSCSLKCYEDKANPSIQELNLPHTPFYFMRHGQTDWNKTKMVQGSFDIPLNETGIYQAHKAGEQLKKVNIEVILSSPLKRARKTAEIVASYLGKSVMILDAVKEAHWGISEGKSQSGENFFEHWKNGKMIDGAECYPCFTQRVFDGLHQALQFAGPVLIIAHGGVYRPIQDILNLEQVQLHNAVPVAHIPPAESHRAWTVSEVF